MMNGPKLKYAMVGGGPKSFIGPIHRMAVRLDDLAELVDGCYSHNDDWRELIERVRGKVDFLTICTPNDLRYAKRHLRPGSTYFAKSPFR